MIKKATMTVAALGLLAWGVASGWAENPFLSGEWKKTEKPEMTASAGISVFQPVYEYSQKIQKQLKTRLTHLAREMQSRPLGKAFWMFLIASFIYGIFHALGPGHGKSVAISYFLSRPGNWFHGFLMGNLLSFVHTFSAVILVIVLYCILNISGISRFDQLSQTIKIVGYTLLVAVGCCLAVKPFRDLRNRPTTGATDAPEIKSIILTSFVTGLIPCPGAAIILSFSVIMKVMPQGLAAMVFMAAGMGITTSGAALLSIFSRNMVLHVMDQQSGTFRWVYATFSLLGALAIVAIGSLLLLGELQAY